MIFKRYLFVILGLWHFWLSVFFLWQWQLREFPAWRWLVISLGLLFLIASAFLSGAARHKERGHPLVDEEWPGAPSTSKETAQEPACLTAWQKVPEKGNRRLIAKMWCEFADVPEIAKACFLSEKAVYNIISDLRPVYGLPTREERQKYLKAKSGSNIGKLGK